MQAKLTESFFFRGGVQAKIRREVSAAICAKPRVLLPRARACSALKGKASLEA
jgi:hypothetical protein